MLGAGLRVAAPMFFAGIIFARWFERTDTPSAALGANLIGAVVGGLLEYLSLVVGLRQLYLLALLFYVRVGSSGVALDTDRAPTRRARPDRLSRAGRRTGCVASGGGRALREAGRAP